MSLMVLVVAAGAVGNIIGRLRDRERALGHDVVSDGLTCMARPLYNLVDLPHSTYDALKHVASS